MNESWPPIEDLFPQIPPERRAVAAERWRGYLDLILRIEKRIAADPNELRELERLLTERENARTMQDRSSSLSEK